MREEGNHGSYEGLGKQEQAGTVEGSPGK